MSDIPAIKRVLLGEKTDRMRKLDMLVRQGMMSPAQLPMLHRGLDKLQAGQTLAPNERAAVAKVMDSLMYIVTGDDTVFQKARQHTQKNRYQTEETDKCDCEDCECDPCECKEVQEEFEPHYMYKGDKKEKAEKPEDHDRLKKMGYSHDKPEVKEEEASLKTSDYPKGTSMSAQKFKDSQKKKKEAPALKTSDYPKGTSMSAKKFVEEFELDMFSESYKTGHKSYTDAVNHAFDHHSKSGLSSTPDHKAQHVGLDSKKPGSGKTTRVNIPATHKSGKKHMVHMQVYNKGGSHPYELNTYSSTTKKLQKEELETIEEKNTPTNPKLWASKISAAKSKFDVYPSAYANGWAAKEYKKAGGGWKSESVEYTTEEPVMEMSYKEKFAAMLKKSGKTLDQMDDDEKTKFFTTVDAAHKAKNEAYGNAPFDGGKPIPKVRKDQFGNVIKDKNVAKNLAKKGMATVKEDDEIEEAALKLKGFGKDAGPSNMSNPIARASLMKSKPAVKKKVSDMTTSEKMANAKRRKEYNEYQQSKRNEEVEGDLDENEIIEPEVVETQTPEVEAVVDQNMQAYVTQITQHAKDTNF
jgi:hypothetical protein